MIDGQPLVQATDFSYLGSSISDNARLDIREIGWVRQVHRLECPGIANRRTITRLYEQREGDAY